MSTEHPILFRDALVVAILDGRKTVTRRVGPTWAGVEPGTRLWVRECHAFARLDYWHDYWQDAPEGGDDEQPTCMEAEEVYYRATPRVGLRRWVGPTAPAPDAFQGRPHRMTYLAESSPLESGPAARVTRWRPSIHMPRWACRLELEVVSVTEEPGRGCNRPDSPELCLCAWEGCAAVPRVDDEEGRREGFEDRAGFLRVWLAMHPDHRGPVWRVAFRRVDW